MSDLSPAHRAVLRELAADERHGIQPPVPLGRYRATVMPLLGRRMVEPNGEGVLQDFEDGHDCYQGNEGRRMKSLEAEVDRVNTKLMFNGLQSRAYEMSAVAWVKLYLHQNQAAAAYLALAVCAAEKEGLL